MSVLDRHLLWLKRCVLRHPSGRPARAASAVTSAALRSGFGDEVVHSGVAADLDVLGEGIGGQRDDRKVAKRPPSGADRAGRGQPVHLGHPHVHEHDVESALRGVLERLAPVGHDASLPALKPCISLVKTMRLVALSSASSTRSGRSGLASATRQISASSRRAAIGCPRPGLAADQRQAEGRALARLGLDA